MAANLVELVRSFRPSRALLTTFTFNTAFFDAAVLPAFSRPEGCDIALLVDAGQFSASIAGGFSSGAGVRYAIAPVTAPGGGIFHPKLALLQNEETTLLVVGSGNLTLPGLSSQLESLDVVELSQAPQVFAEFGAFCGDLARLISARSPHAAGILSHYAQRCSAATGSADGSAGALRLVHTLRVPAAQQMERVLRERSVSTRCMTVLSPFHGEGGGPVKRLASTVGASVTRIGVHGTAPFERHWYDVLPYVAPMLNENQAREGKLHAKVFEFETEQGTLIVTGSVNATHQSLETCNNIEVSLARWCDNSPFAWEATVPSRFRVPTLAPTRPSGPPLEADLDLDGWVRGLLGIARAATARWTVLEADRVHAEGSCNIRGDGTFEFPLVPDIQQAHLGLVLVLQTEAGISPAWLNDRRSLLRARSSSRMPGRATPGGQRGADIDYILGVLSRALAGRVTGGGQGGGEAAPDLGEEESEEQVFSYADWIRSGTLRGQSRRLMGSTASQLLAGVYRLLEDPDETPVPDTPVLRGGTDADEERAGPGGAKKKSQSAARGADTEARRKIAAACRSIREAFLERRTTIQAPEILALVVSAHELSNLRIAWRTTAATTGIAAPRRSCFLWLDQLCRFPFADADRALLLPIACALACAVGLRIGPYEGPPEPLQLAQLKLLLQRLAGADLNAEDLGRQAAAGLRDDLFWTAGVRDAAPLLSVSQEIAAACALDELLLATTGPGRAAAPELLRGELRHLAPVILAGPRPRSVVVVTEHAVRAGGCSCGFHFDQDERVELKIRRMIRHPANKDPRSAHLVVYPDRPTDFIAQLGALYAG